MGFFLSVGGLDRADVPIVPVPANKLRLLNQVGQDRLQVQVAIRNVKRQHPACGQF